MSDEMDNPFLNEPVSVHNKPNWCGCEFKLNGNVFICVMEKGHEGEHVSEPVKVSQRVYDGFTWKVTPEGNVEMSLPERVSLTIFDWGPPL